MAANEKRTNEELVERLQTAGAGTPEAADIMEKLWSQNEKLILHTVHRLTGLTERESGFEDMRQQAYFGFHAAAFSYDPEAGAKFSSYAVRHIQWELCRYYEQNGYTAKIPAYMKRRIKECKKKREQMEAETGRSVSYKDALQALGLSPAAVDRTLSALRKMKTESIDRPLIDGENSGDETTLLNLLADGTDIEENVLAQEWHRELHDLLIKAIRELPEETQAVITRHYFNDISLSRMAEDYGVTRQTMYEREQKGFEAIRAGKYGAELAEYAPTESSKVKADRLIKEAREALERLQLTDWEKELIAL